MDHQMGEGTSRLTLKIDTEDAEASLQRLRALAEDTGKALESIESSGMASLETAIKDLTYELQLVRGRLDDEARRRRVATSIL